ncbi:MAG: O-antigen ligase family protein [Parvibaculum sp.]|uniref:O-antigen ligase family protein n=1 Tax=Parvibaculum sp. TaxID=2024848 RepID=UPI0025DD6150|nr:O-antigen ligase family protein [Parvibaculum sp.]MCE9649348.1 O-antigen ligase family protein [Parvibaculum sp.]
MDGWFPDEEGRRGRREPSRPPFVWSERLGDLLIFLVIFSSFYQKSTPGESQPVLFDLLLILCMGFFFAFGLKFPRGLVWPVSTWGMVLAGYGIGGMTAMYVDKVNSFIQVAAYLVCAFIFISSYVYEAPERRLRLMFNAYATGAVVAAMAGVGGYFGMLPNAESYTGFGRASGTFNDPNVYGPYLIAPALYLGLRLSKAKSAASLLLIPLIGILVLGLLLSFSRGAWGNFLLSGAIFMGLTLATSRSTAQSMRLIAFSAVMGVIVVTVVGIALSTPKVEQLFEQRAALTQDYDTGNEGRFESQRHALVMALNRPLGIGPEQWAIMNKLDTHNVYLNVLVGGGFLAGIGFLAFLGMTFVAGKRAVFANGPGQEYLIVAYACIVGHMAEAFIIDVDNWRHLFLLFGMTWGCILAAKARANAPVRRTPRESQAISGFPG